MTKHPTTRYDRIVNAEKKQRSQEERRKKDSVWRKRAEDAIKAQEAEDALRAAAGYHLPPELC